MFYLSRILFFLKKHPFRFGSLLLGLILLFSFFSSYGFLTKKAEAYFLEDKRSYFNAVISEKVNISGIKRKLLNFPEIKKFKIVSRKEMSRKIFTTFKKLEVVGEIGKLELDNKVAVQIMFHPSIGQKSKELIREYVVRLSGNNHIVAGPVINSKTKNGPAKKFLKKYWNFGASGILILFWALSFIDFNMSAKKYFYLFEHYQRKTHVQFKFNMILIGGGGLFFLPTSILVAFGEWQNVLIVSAILLTTPIFFIRDAKWI